MVPCPAHFYLRTVRNLVTLSLAAPKRLVIHRQIPRPLDSLPPPSPSSSSQAGCSLESTSYRIEPFSNCFRCLRMPPAHPRILSTFCSMCSSSPRIGFPVSFAFHFVAAPAHVTSFQESASESSHRPLVPSPALFLRGFRSPLQLGHDTSPVVLSSESVPMMLVRNPGPSSRSSHLLSFPTHSSRLCASIALFVVSEANKNFFPPKNRLFPSAAFCPPHISARSLAPPPLLVFSKQP